MNKNEIERKQRIVTSLQSQIKHERDRLELSEEKLEHAQEEVERHQASVDFHENKVADLEYQLKLVEDA